ncbi:hypothetical protein Tco_1413167 [Tanacetum coccineum]
MLKLPTAEEKRKKAKEKLDSNKQPISWYIIFTLREEFINFEDTKPRLKLQKREKIEDTTIKAMYESVKSMVEAVVKSGIVSLDR